MFLWRPSPLVNGGPLLCLPCSVWVCQCLHLLVGVVDWCELAGKANLLSDHVNRKQSREDVDLPGLPLTCHPFPCLSPLRSGRVRLGIPRWTSTLMVALIHWVSFLIFLRELMFWPPRLSAVFRRLVRLGSSSGLLEMSPQFQKVTPTQITMLCCSALCLYCQLPTYFNDIRIVKGVAASGVCSFRTIYITQWCASNLPVCLSERSGYLWCTFERVPHLKGHWRVGRRLGSCRLISE